MSIETYNCSGGKCPPSDYTLTLPDECLSSILQSLNNHHDRNNSSLVCHRWLRIESHTRRTLKLHAHLHFDSSIFARFDSITDLALIGHSTTVLALIDRRRRQRPAAILNTTALFVSSPYLNHLKRLTLSNCKVAPGGVDALSKICARLEELHLEQVEVGKEIGSDASLLKVISLKDIEECSVCFLVQLIKASKSLKTFKLHSYRFRKLGMLLVTLPDTVTQIHLEMTDVNDTEMGLISSCCPKLEVLCLVSFFGDCSDAGMAMVANNCRFIRKLHIKDNWNRGRKTYPIGDESLIALANNCPNIEELVLDSVGVTELSLRILFSNCVKLGTLSLCSIQLKDAELICIASECNALKKLWIEVCPVSYKGIQALANGCPSLAEVMFRECPRVTTKGIRLLKESRASLAVDFNKVGKGTLKAPYKQFCYGHT